MNALKKFGLFLRYRLAVIKADEAHKKNGKKYFVIPTKTGKLLIVDRKNYRILKRKFYLPNESLYKDLPKECLYCTPDKSERGGTIQPLKELFRIYVKYVDGIKVPPLKNRIRIFIKKVLLRYI